jgi:hypothetical protein
MEGGMLERKESTSIAIMSKLAEGPSKLHTFGFDYWSLP